MVRLVAKAFQIGKTIPHPVLIRMAFLGYRIACLGIVGLRAGGPNLRLIKVGHPPASIPKLVGKTRERPGFLSPIDQVSCSDGHGQQISGVPTAQ